MRQETIELLKKLAAVRDSGEGFSKDLEAEMAAFLVETRDKLPD
jgi:hypothetical protein